MNYKLNPHKLLQNPILQQVAIAHVEIQEAFGLKVLPGWEVFRMYDEQGIPLDLIRSQCKANKITIDEWGLRLCMYLAGQNVPVPVQNEIPFRAEDVDDPIRIAKANEAWANFKLES